MWSAPSVNSLDSLLSEAERDQVSRYLGEITTERMSHIRAGAVATIRSYCGKQGLGPAGTIPDECAGAFDAIFRYKVLSSLPIDDLVTEARRTDYTEAMKTLRDIAKGDAVISTPYPADTPSEGMSAGTVLPSICLPAGHEPMGT